MTKICAILTCHNRKSSTLECLHLLEAASKVANVALNAVLVDDGSSDGTTDAVTEDFNWVQVLHGDGSLFWSRGMHLAMGRAMVQQPDFILWINDDTHLYSDSIARLLTTYDEKTKNGGKPVIVVGATTDINNETLTYGGHISVSKCRPFTYKKVWSATDAVECDTMNGNLVLIPNEVVAKVGNLDPTFEHAMGDIDYALRAKKAGFALFVAPGFVGNCSNNPVLGTFNDRSLPLSERWKKMLSRKGLPIKSWLRFTSRHGGLLWPLYFGWPYLKLVVVGSLQFLKFEK